MRFYLLTVCGIILVAMKGIIWEIFKKEKNITSSVSLSWGINKTNLYRFFFCVPQRRFEAIWLAL